MSKVIGLSAFSCSHQNCMGMRTKRFLFVLLFLFVISTYSASATQGYPERKGIILMVESDAEVREAHILRTLYYGLPTSFLLCLDEFPSQISKCGEMHLDQSGMESLEALFLQYCRTISIFPEWVGMAPNYRLSSGIRGYAINFPDMEKRLGDVCES